MRSDYLFILQGWDEGIIGMRPGGTRIITIAANKAFGSEGNEELSVPPNATIQISEF